MADPQYLTVVSLTRAEIDWLFQRIAVDPVTDCWLWTASGNQNGYGGMQFRGRFERTHRVVYAWRIQPIPRGVGRDIPQLDHIVCNTPRCCNPAHLRLTTLKENLLRGMAPTAINARKTHCVRGHELPHEPNIYTWRRCPLCQAIRDANRPKRDKSAYMKAYYLKHREKLLRYQSAYRVEHRDELLRVRLT